MSKIVYVYFRNRADRSITANDINALSARLMPDSLRANKSLIKEIVVADSPGIPFATHEFVNVDIFRRTEAVKLMTDYLDIKYVREIFSKDIIDYVLPKISTEAGTALSVPAWRKLAKFVLPKSVQDTLRNNIQLVMGFSKLAFRMYLVGKAIEMFEADANLLTMRSRLSPQILNL